MCYKCNVCSKVVPAGQALVKHTTYKELPGPSKWECGAQVETTIRQIHSEVPVCQDCKKLLNEGTPLLVLQRARGVLRRPQAEPAVATLKAAPLPPASPYQPKALEIGTLGGRRLRKKGA